MWLDSITFVGGAGVVALEEAECLHKQIIESGCKSIVFVGTSLVDMYANVGVGILLNKMLEMSQI